MTNCDLSQEYKFGSLLENTSKIINQINKPKKKSHMIIMIVKVKNLSKLGVERNFFNLIKGIYKILV